MERQRKTELRIGNLLMHEGKTETVSSVHSDGTVRFYSENKKFCHGCYGLINVDPIPLTEEWVLKLGGYEYPNKKGILYLGGANIRYIVSSNRIEVAVAGPGHDGCDIWDDEFKHIDSVHMIQNLFFFLENEELTINE